ncbi:MAG TPA: uroporphyrinogen decarboxylase [Geminicoccaceae bacterium]
MSSDANQDSIRESRSGVTKPLLAALAGEAQARPPVWLMRQAGRYLPEYRALRTAARSFLEFCYTPDLAVEVALQPIRRYGFDAAILFSDILVVPDALGAKVDFVEGEGPRLEPTRTAAAIERLDPARLRPHLAPVYEAVRRLRAELPERVALIGFSGAPWTLAAYMVEGRGTREFAAARRLAREERQLFAALVDILTAAVADHLCAQVEAGAEAVQIFDSWAGALPEEERERWVVAPAREVVRLVRARHPAVPIIAFPRGVGAGYLRYADAVPADGIGLDTTVPMAWAARALRPGGRLCLQGNLDPMALLGPVEAMLAEAGRIVAAAGGRPLIFNLGHGVVPETPPEAVAALVEHLKSGAL